MNFFFFAHFCTRTRYVVEVTAVLIIMAIEAKVFPIASVRGVIVVVVVLVVHGPFMKIFASKLAAATGTYPGVDFE